jgi:hypothetical protein
MEFVAEAMNHGRQQNGNRGDENHPATQGIERGEQFSPDRVEFAYRPHSGQDHCRVQEGVQPGKPRTKVVAKNTQPEGNFNVAEGERQVCATPAEQKSFEAAAVWFDVQTLWKFTSGSYSASPRKR